MQSIEINTSQNVVIDYELASLRDRLLAFLLDSVIIWGSMFFLMGIGVLAFGAESSRYITYFILAPIFFFYTISLEIFNGGQTWGKQALNIKVAALSGRELSFNDFLIRWTFRMVDIYFSFGAVAVIIISSTDKNQRLGDILAKTAIIKSKPSVILKLNNILNLNSYENYKVTYSEVRKFSEEDMLLIKKVMDQSKKYSNTAHQEALDSLVDNLVQQLSISKKPGNKMEFLKTVLQDYIVLTR